MPETQTLSERETEILLLIASGKSNKEIAHELQISANTVKVHVRNIFGKLEVSSRTEASMVALREGLIDAGPILDDLGGEDEEEEEVPVGAVGEGSTAEGTDGSNPSAETVLPGPAPAPSSASGPQPWFVIGFVIIVVLLTTIAVRLYNPAPAATPVPSAEQVEPVAVESRWVEKAPLPAPRSHAAAVSLENQIYLVAGLNARQPSSDLLRFDPDSGSWTRLAKKPTPVSDIQAAVLGDQIYVPGGNLSNGEATDLLEIYNPRSDTWETGPNLPIPLSAYGLAAYEGKLYLFGGWDGSTYSNKVFSYSPADLEWQELTPLPIPLGYPGVSIAAGRIYVIGGFDGEEASRQTYTYTPSLEENNPWKSVAEMPEGRYAMGLASIADKIHLIGGLGGEGSTFSQMDFTPQTKSWQVLENPLAGEWAYLATTAIGTEIYVLGGEINGADTDRNLAYQVVFVVVIPTIR